MFKATEELGRQAKGLEKWVFPPIFFLLREQLQQAAEFFIWLKVPSGITAIDNKNILSFAF